MRLGIVRTSFIAIAWMLGLSAAGRARGDVVYLALGDSITWGNDATVPSSTRPSYGDQGFVRPLADDLAGQDGGVRPIVDNLAISGELASSYFYGPPPGWNFRSWQWNLNYPNGTTTQELLASSTIAAIHSAGNSVGYVSLLFGLNDLTYLVTSSAYQNASPAAQLQMISATVLAVQADYTRALDEIQHWAPEAKIILPNYYNQYPTSMASQRAFEGNYLSQLTPLIQQDAATYGAAYADVYSAFNGHELAYTSVGMGDGHPNETGYGVIAGVIEPTLIPGPSSLLGLATGLISLAGYGWRRRLCPANHR